MTAEPVQDFREHLTEQLYFLRRSCDAYDAGTEIEAKSLAATIRTIVHDTNGPTTSLLTHLGVKQRLGFVDSAPPDPPARVIVLTFGLCVLVLPIDGRQPYYRPAGFGDAQRTHPSTSFVDWWTLPVLRDQRGNTFSRRDLVLTVANKDGGAHIDATLQEAYLSLTRDNSMGFTGGDGEPIRNSVTLGCIRQIAEELMQTIERGLRLETEPVAVRDPVCPLPYAEASAMRRNDACACGGPRKAKFCGLERAPRLKVRLGPNREPWVNEQPVSDPPPNPNDGEAVIFDGLYLVPVPSSPSGGR